MSPPGRVGCPRPAHLRPGAPVHLRACASPRSGTWGTPILPRPRPAPRDKVQTSQYRRAGVRLWSPVSLLEAKTWRRWLEGRRRRRRRGGRQRAREAPEGRKAWVARGSGTRTAALGRGCGSGRLRGTATPTRAGRAAPPYPALAAWSVRSGQRHVYLLAASRVE